MSDVLWLDHDPTGSVVVCCPYHHEKTPSCKIDFDGGTFHCFGCGASGDLHYSTISIGMVRSQGEP